MSDIRFLGARVRATIGLVGGAAVLLLALPATPAAASDCSPAQRGTQVGDQLVGSASEDAITGRGGADVIKGLASRDCLLGGLNADLMRGGVGKDRLAGGRNRDLINSRDGWRDMVSCGRGRDRAMVDQRDRVARSCERVRRRKMHKHGDDGPGGGGGGTPPSGYVPQSHLGPIPAGASYVSPSGSDSAPGTAEQPWRTLQRAIDSAGPGDTIVLMPGDYGRVGTTTDFDATGTRSAQITYRGHPDGPMPRVLGFAKITGDYQRLNYLLFDGPTGEVKPRTSDNPDGEQVQISIYGPSVDGVEISDSEIRQSGWHAGIYMSTANDVRITGNYVHDNGDFDDPVQENTSHGVYFSSGSGLIANNVIEHNVARGIQLYTRPHDVVMANNTIVRNGKSGIQIANDTRDSIAVNNVVAYNGEYGIRSSSLTGDGNVVRRNLVFGNAGNNLTLTDGLSLDDNLQVHPGFGPGDDLRPPSGSPVVDRAVPQHAPDIDFDGIDRPLGAAPDLGAFEAN